MIDHTSNCEDIDSDAVVVGSGLGGSSFAYGLASRGFRVVVVDEGRPVRFEPGDLTPVHQVLLGNGPKIGGLTKTFGAAMYRLREQDFVVTEMEVGPSPAWPISYGDLEPFYAVAETLYKVHGTGENDATEPRRSTPWPYPQIPHQGPVVDLVARIRSRTGLPVGYIPRSLDYDPPGGSPCVLCRHCDAYLCRRGAKMDAEIGALRPALQTGRVTLLPETTCVRVLTSADGKRALGVRVRSGGEEFTIHAPTVALAAGVVGTPIVLHRSGGQSHPHGLANGSRSLGRYAGAHRQGWVFPIARGVQRTQFHQKTFAINAFYQSSEAWPYPMGTIQAAGYIEPLSISRRYRPFVTALLHNSFHTFIMSESIPGRETGFALSDTKAQLVNPPRENPKTFKALRQRAIGLFRRAGYRVLAPRMYDFWHWVGTARMGNDPSTSVVDSRCMAHDVEGLYVVDASALPSAGALNTGLTIAAVALRAAALIPTRG